jgi:sialate O-acetylesterase
VGEVWIASGQSNMALQLANAKGTPEEKAADPLIRLLHLPLNPQAKPVDQIGASWQADESERLGGFSAVAYYFARHLTATRKVPVGIINSSVGGTPARAWTSWESMASDPRLKHQTDRIEADMKKYDPAVAEQKYREALAQYEAATAKQPAGKTLKKPTPPVPPSCYQHSPAALYNGMIAPLAPMAIRGAIWYQGEADAKVSAEYRILLPALINAWRKAFGHEIPFLFVQIAPHGMMLPEIRDAQLYVWRTVPKTAMAVITDYGDATNIHPKDKKPVGDRLGLAARAIAYGENITYSGPIFDQIKIEGDKAILSFQHVGGGLVAKDGALKGFEISGDGSKFVPATAEIQGTKVVVTNDTIKAPVAVRFGWANVPDTNLFNKEGLPASPFKTAN